MISLDEGGLHTRGNSGGRSHLESWHGEAWHGVARQGGAGLLGKGGPHLGYPRWTVPFTIAAWRSEAGYQGAWPGRTAPGATSAFPFHPV